MRQALPTTLPAEFRKLVETSVDIALLDLAGKYFGAPAYELLGGRVRDVVAISWVSYMRPAALLEDEIKGKLREGYKEFKLRAGDIEMDLERVRTFRQIAGDQVFLRIDASGLWGEDDVVEPQFKCYNGTLSVPQAPGLGIRLETQKLQKYCFSSG